jgi:hypothetical protein
MPYSKKASSFVMFEPQLTLQEYIDIRHEMWRASRGLSDFVSPEPFCWWTLTNIWRELDRTTCYVINTVMPRWPDGSAEQLLELAAFRSLGKIETDVAVSSRFGSWVDAIDHGWEAMYVALPPKPLTGAYARMIGTKRALWAGPIIKRRDLHHQAAQELAARPDEAHRLLADDTYLGNFVASQVILDVTWRGGPFTPWNTGALGPGAGHGLSLATGIDYLHTRRGNVEVEPAASAAAAALLPTVRAGTGSPFVAGRPAPFEQRELENVLCEYSRVARLMRFGRVAALRTYRPNGALFELAPGWTAV